jgi:hypothetical protein
MLAKSLIQGPRRRSEPRADLVELRQGILNMHLIEFGHHPRINKTSSKRGHYRSCMHLKQNQMFIGQRDQSGDFVIIHSHGESFNGLQKWHKALAQACYLFRVKILSVVIKITGNNSSTRKNRSQKNELSDGCFACILLGFAAADCRSVPCCPDQAQNRCYRANCLYPRSPFGRVQTVVEADQHKIHGESSSQQERQEYAVIQPHDECCHLGIIA